MKSSLLIAFIAISSFATFAQDSSSFINPHLNYRFGLKLYNGLTLEEGGDILGNKHLNYIISPTFQWKNKRNNFQEIGLNDFSTHSSAYFNSKDFNISLRYEYLINFLKFRNTRWVPALGIGATPYYTYAKLPSTIPENNETYKEWGAGFFVAPHITYYLGKRWFIDLNIPINLASVSVNQINKKDVTVSQKPSKYSTQSFEATTSGSGIRLGIGIKL